MKKMQLAQVVIFEGRVPKRLRIFLAKHLSHQVRMVTYVTEGGLRYEAELRSGWTCGGEHTAVTNSAAGLIARLGSCVPCKCAKCGGA